MPAESTPENIAHLLRRAAWGGTPEEIDTGVSAGIEATVDALLDAGAAAPAGEPLRSLVDEEATDIAYGPDALVLWWYRLAATSPTPGLERLAWFWHGHFATSLHKVEYPDLMHRQLVTLRRLALGRFDDLLLAVTHDPAMNVWLDLHLSAAGAPNENYARELLELFSMGSGNGYTQPDVVAAARALTGYSLVSTPPHERPVGTRLDPLLHDYGTKTFLGRRGNFTGADIVDVVVERPECHRFVVGRLWHRYAGTAVPDSVLDDLAAVFAAELSVRDVLRALLRRDEFYEPQVKAGLVTQPVEILVRTIRNFALPVPDVTTATVADIEERDEDLWAFWWWGEVMGQIPGYPPNVGGWPHNEAWLDSNRAAGRFTVGRDIGYQLTHLDSPVAEGLRSLADSPRALADAVLAQFGLVEWSATTGDAVTAAARAAYPEQALTDAFTTAFTSPEVTLA